MSDGNRTYTWRHGRQLATVAQNGSTWTNTYDANGMRVSRTDGTATYTYVYNGSQLTQLSIYGETMRFTYDEVGNPMILTHEGVEYYYVTNPQGDVLAIVDATGYPVATYHYDPWGKVLTYTAEGDGFIGSVNPLLYRGYVYDWDTELYYLQSRYYDPSLRRFLNADILTSTGQGIVGNNMFVYCLNNPVNLSDETGTVSVLAIALIAVTTVAAIGIDHYVAKHEEGEVYLKGPTKKGDPGARWIFATGSGFSCDQNGLRLLDSEIGVYKEKEDPNAPMYADIGFLTASAKGAVDWSGNPSIDTGAIASLVSANASYTFTIMNIKITISGQVYWGASCGVAEVDFDEGKFRFAPPSKGFSSSWGVDFDYA